MKKSAGIVAVVLAIGLFFGFLWGRSVTPPTQIVSAEPVIVTVPAAPVKNQVVPASISAPIVRVPQTASLMIDYGSGLVRVYPDIRVATGETMISLLEKQTAAAKLDFKTKNFTGLGLMVETIGGKSNGDENKYWQYWVNNVVVPYAASTYVVKAGDVIEWKFLHYQ